MHPDSQSVYHIEASKLVGPTWLLILVNALGRLVRSGDQSLPRSAGVQANLKGIHAISWRMCAILQKISGKCLSLRLEYV